MTSETKLHDQIAKGDMSKLVLKELETAFKKLDEQCWQAFKLCESHDTEAQMRLKSCMDVTEDLKEYFIRSIHDGEAALKQFTSKTLKVV